MSSRRKGKSALPEIRNAKAGRDYDLGERFEAGIVLTGTEVKSIRAGRAQISEAFGRVQNGEVFLYNMHIAEYAFGTINNHVPNRPRKLLLKAREIRKIQHEIEAGGRALVPVRVYFKGSLVKVELALGTGKKLYDKRQDLKKRAQMREVERAMSLRR
ncbi:MAG: SsrA-binding protein SmpB [Verrucomicrobia bacterium]|nr:MAG: SsrA-binding protein SmpB [Verrucomicrobiota bacterium]